MLDNGESALLFEKAQRSRLLALARRAQRIREHGHFLRQPNALAAGVGTARAPEPIVDSLQGESPSGSMQPEPDAANATLLIHAAEHCRRQSALPKCKTE